MTTELSCVDAGCGPEPARGVAFERKSGMPRFETTLDAVCDAIGYTRTRILQCWFPGRAVWVPSTAPADHPLVALIGLPGLRALVAAFPGERIEIPSEAADQWAGRERRIAESLADGKTLAEISAAEGLSDSRVRQLRDELALRGWLQYAEGPPKKGRGRWRIAERPQVLGLPPTAETA